MAPAGAPAIHIELTNDSETVPSEKDGSGAVLAGTGGHRSYILLVQS